MPSRLPNQYCRTKSTESETRNGGHGIEPANLVHGIEATKLRPRNRDREIKIGKVRSRNRAQTPDGGYEVDGAESSLRDGRPDQGRGRQTVESPPGPTRDRPDPPRPSRSDAAVHWNRLFREIPIRDHIGIARKCFCNTAPHWNRRFRAIPISPIQIAQKSFSNEALHWNRCLWAIPVLHHIGIAGK